MLDDAYRSRIQAATHPDDGTSNTAAPAPVDLDMDEPAPTYKQPHLPRPSSDAGRPSTPPLPTSLSARCPRTPTPR